MTAIKSIGVIGAGQMGAGIAQVAAMSGYQTVLFDSFPGALDKGMSLIASLLKKGVEKEKYTKQFADETLGRIKTAASMKDLEPCGLAIEAIVENLEAKLKLFAELDHIMQKDALLCTNTSSISITRIAAGTSRPDKVMGMHFMNPVPVMKLVELIRGLQTSDATYQSVRDVCEILAKRLDVTEIHSDPALRSEAAPSDTVAALGRYDGSTIICVGHQPNISASISLALAGSVKSIIQVGRGAACGVRFAGSCRPGAGELLFLLPRQLFQPE